jgi:hypothetical protein
VSKFEEYEKLSKASTKTINAENDTRATEGEAKEPKIEAPTTPIAEEKHVEDETEKVSDPEPIPVPVEPGPVIIEEEKKEEEPTPVPVPVEPGPVIIETEEVVDDEESDEYIEEESDEEVEETTEELQNAIVNHTVVNVSKKHKKNRH